jgi:hypothetical protein
MAPPSPLKISDRHCGLLERKVKIGSRGNSGNTPWRHALVWEEDRLRVWAKEAHMVERFLASQETCPSHWGFLFGDHTAC